MTSCPSCGAYQPTEALTLSKVKTRKGTCCMFLCPACRSEMIIEPWAVRRSGWCLAATVAILGIVALLLTSGLYGARNEWLKRVQERQSQVEQLTEELRVLRLANAGHHRTPGRHRGTGISGHTRARDRPGHGEGKLATAAL